MCSEYCPIAYHVILLFSTIIFSAYIPYAHTIAPSYKSIFFPRKSKKLQVYLILLSLAILVIYLNYLDIYAIKYFYFLLFIITALFLLIFLNKKLTNFSNRSFMLLLIIANFFIFLLIYIGFPLDYFAVGYLIIALIFLYIGNMSR